MKDNLKITKSKTLLIAFNCILFVIMVISSVSIVVDKSRIKSGVIYTGGDAKTNENAVQNTPNANKTSSAKLMFAGDNLIHRSIFKQAEERANGEGYDFSYAYDGIKSLISSADLAFINQETVMSAEDEISSAPDFNSPTQLLDDMIKVGFDVFNQSNNHVFDMGLSGVESDLELFKSKGNSAMLTGVYDTWNEMLQPHVKEVSGIKFSFVNCTEWLNYNDVPQGSELGLLYLTDERYTDAELYGTLKNMILNAKKSSDVVCVSMHWKTEGISEPDESQQEIVKKLLEYGADVIIGTGPQVLQPMEFKKNGDGKDALVIWSLGDFISCQDEINMLLGGIADVTFTKNLSTNEVEITSAKLIPTVTHYGEECKDVRIIPLKDYTAELAESHGIREEDSDFSLEYINEYYKKMFGDMLGQ